MAADPATVASLPPAWESDREAGARPMEARRYEELVSRVQALAAREQEARARVRRLRRVREMLAPFGGGGGGVQENLVTRDGEVERELERMRMLLARVGGKVARLREGGGGGEGEHGDADSLFGDGDHVMVGDVEAGERRKVDGLLDALG